MAGDSPNAQKEMTLTTPKQNQDGSLQAAGRQQWRPREWRLRGAPFPLALSSSRPQTLTD